jgi:hypothetical protein
MTEKLAFVGLLLMFAAAVLMSAASLTTGNYIAAFFAWSAACWSFVAFTVAKKLPPDKP